jgi:hypothetical protein
MRYGPQRFKDRYTDRNKVCAPNADLTRAPNASDLTCQVLQSSAIIVSLSFYRCHFILCHYHTFERFRESIR